MFVVKGTKAWSSLLRRESSLIQSPSHLYTPAMVIKHNKPQLRKISPKLVIVKRRGGPGRRQGGRGVEEREKIQELF